MVKKIRTIDDNISDRKKLDKEYRTKSEMLTDEFEQFMEKTPEK